MKALLVATVIGLTNPQIFIDGEQSFFQFEDDSDRIQFCSKVISPEQPADQTYWCWTGPTRNEMLKGLLRQGTPVGI